MRGEADMFPARRIGLGFMLGSFVLLTALSFSLFLQTAFSSAGQPSATPATAIGNPPSGGCSVASLKGTFGVLERGTITVQLPGFPPPPYPFSNSALATYDGAGHFSGSFTASDAGVVVPGTFSGTYTVGADCTYADEFTIQPTDMVSHHKGAIVGEGPMQEIRYIYNDPGIVANGTAGRTPPGGCSVATLKGTYMEAQEGTLVQSLPDLPPAPLPGVQTGVTTYDGAGHFSGEFVANFGGVIVSGSGGGTYTVNADCTYSDVGTSGDAAGTENVGNITGNGTFQELHTMYAVPWLVATGTSKKP
jgi:hypothetical protein